MNIDQPYQLKIGTSCFSNNHQWRCYAIKPEGFCTTIRAHMDDCKIPLSKKADKRRRIKGFPALAHYQSVGVRIHPVIGWRSPRQVSRLFRRQSTPRSTRVQAAAIPSTLTTLHVLSYIPLYYTFNCPHSGHCLTFQTENGPSFTHRHGGMRFF